MIDLATARETFEASTDYTVGIEEEFALLDPGTNQLVDAGVKIIFNYSEALLHVPPEVTVHTSSPAVDLLYALYFYLT